MNWQDDTVDKLVTEAFTLGAQTMSHLEVDINNARKRIDQLHEEIGRYKAIITTLAELYCKDLTDDGLKYFLWAILPDKAFAEQVIRDIRKRRSM